jgi:hypothetical protein
MLHHLNRIKDKIHVLISIGTEKAVNKLQHPFLIKNSWARGITQVVECLFSKHKALSSNSSTAKKEKKILNSLDIKGKFLNIIKGICEKPTANIVISGEQQVGTPTNSTSIKK